jgi:hypothetical protein
MIEEERMSLNLNALLEALPIDDAVRIELCEGVPVFRAPPHVQERIEDLLEKQRAGAVTAEEARELSRHEELDDFLSLVNRLVRNTMHAGKPGAALGSAA